MNIGTITKLNVKKVFVINKKLKKDDLQLGHIVNHPNIYINCSANNRDCLN